MSGGFVSVLCFHRATVEPTQYSGRKKSALYAEHLRLGLQGITEKCGESGTGEELG